MTTDADRLMDVIVEWFRSESSDPWQVKHAIAVLNEAKDMAAAWIESDMEGEQEPNNDCPTCGGSGGGPEHWRCPSCLGSGLRKIVHERED